MFSLEYRNIATYCVKDNIRSCGQVLDELRIREGANDGIYAEFLELLGLLWASDESSDLKLARIGMTLKTLEHGGANVA
jgi:hypothetical protein